MDIRPAFSAGSVAREALETETAKAGWDSVEQIFITPEALHTQPASHLLYVLEKNLKLAKNYDAPFRVYARLAGADDFWEARAARIESIIDYIETNAE